MTYSEIKKVTQNLTEINPIRIYGEIILLGVFSWIFFTLSLLNESLLYLFIASFFMYRGHSLIHEVSHLRKTLKHYEFLYNFFFGFPNKIPAYSIRTHRFHHGINTFSTNQDPEYEKWTSKPAYFLLRPAILCNIYPLFLLLRFGVWPLIALITPKNFSKYVYTYLSSFVMNLKYERPFNDKEYKEVKKSDLIMSLVFLSSLVIANYFEMMKIYLIYWYIMGVFLFLLNTYRALVAHRYLAHNNPKKLDLENQLNDSVTIEGNILTELWAPNGLRYHSTHHYLPNVPYYNLGKAHRILKKTLPKSHPYFSTIEPNFTSAFSKLFSSCKRGKYVP